MTDELTDTALTTVDLTCPACLERGRPLRLVVDERYRLVRCRRCRSEYFRPDPSLWSGAAPSVSEYWEDYKFALYADPVVQRDYERRHRKVLRNAERSSGAISSVLDVGCGIGNFVAFAQQEQMVAYGVDVEQGAVAVARSRGLDVRPSADLDEMLYDQSVDAVTMWDVIEHLYDPAPVVRRVLTKLRPGGVFLLETPDAAFPIRRLVLAAHALTRGRVDVTSHMYYWEHKIYFSEAGLRSFLERSGCTVVQVCRETSPRAKMQELFGRDSRSRQDRVLARLWPLLEALARRARAGNKLVVVARTSAVSA